jgi:hypothetical protein
VSRWWRCAVGLCEATRDGTKTPSVHDSPSVSGIAGEPTTLG